MLELKMPEYDGKVHIFTGLYWGFLVSYIGSYSTFLAGTAWFLIVTYYTQPTWQTIINSIIYTFYERVIASSIDKIIDELASSGVPDFITGSILFIITTAKSILTPSSTVSRSSSHRSSKRNRSPRIQIINDNDSSINDPSETPCPDIPNRDDVISEPPSFTKGFRGVGATLLGGDSYSNLENQRVTETTIYENTIAFVSQQLLAIPKDMVAASGAPTPRFEYESPREGLCLGTGDRPSNGPPPVVPPKIRIRGAK